jgi:hypothetical protein
LLGNINFANTAQVDGVRVHKYIIEISVKNCTIKS